MSEASKPALGLRILAVVGALALIAAIMVAGGIGWVYLQHEAAGIKTSDALSAFYTAPTNVPATPGAIIRSEPLEYGAVGGTGYRIVYVGTDSTGAPVPVSGMIWLPSTPAPAGGRKVIAYAHGTVGTAPKCAPSRATTMAENGTLPWLAPALQRGYVVVETDYVGLGIPATSTYMLGDQEARDVVTSVRAAQAFPGSQAGSDWIVWGSSQGGNSALWTATLAPSIAPDLNLRAVMAAVPAAELGATVEAQWNQPAVWALGPAVLSSWIPAYPQLDFTSVLTPSAKAELSTLNGECIVANAVRGLANSHLGKEFFTSNPTQNAAWAQVIAEQSPPPPPAALPMFMAQGTADEVVLAGSNALLQEQWCAAGRPMTTLWLGGVSHQDSSLAGGPAAIEWAADRFAGLPAIDTCAAGVPAPVEPLPNPVPRA